MNQAVILGKLVKMAGLPDHLDILTDENNDQMQFSSKDEAVSFLKKKGIDRPAVAGIRFLDAYQYNEFFERVDV